MCIIKSYQKTVEKIDIEEFCKENKDDNDYGR